MNLVDQLNSLWNGLLDFLVKLVSPDWGALIGLLPIFLVLFVLGPLLSLTALAWFIYVVRRPRASLAVLEGPFAAPRDEAGHPRFPTGEPFCVRDELVFPSGSTVCVRCRDELGVTCPKCGIGRQARVSTCANCGLVLKIDRNAETHTLRPAGPPSGGAAAA